MECPLSSRIERIMTGELPGKDLFTNIIPEELKKEAAKNVSPQKRAADSLRIRNKKKQGHC